MNGKRATPASLVACVSNAQWIADNYEELHISDSYNVTELANIRAIIEDRAALDRYADEYKVHADEVADGVARIKANKWRVCVGIDKSF